MGYDTEIRVHTKIDNSEFLKSGEQIEDTLEDIKKQAEEIKEVPFDWDKHAKDMAEVSKQVASIEKSLDKTSSKSEETSSHFNLLKVDVEEYAKTLKELGEQGKYFGDADYDKVYISWQNAKKAVREYEAELNKQTAGGKEAEQKRVQALTEKEQQKNDARVKQEEAEQRRIEELAEKNLQRENARIERETLIQSIIAKQVAEEQRLATIKSSAQVSDRNVVQTLERRKVLIAEIKQLEAAGVGVGYKDWEERNGELGLINENVKKYTSALFDVNGEQKQTSTGLKKISILGKKTFSSLGKEATKTGGLLSILASRFKGIALSLLIFNWITRGFNSMVAGMKEGFKNLIKYSDSYAESVADLKNANTQLQNSFAAAFAPIVQMIIPQLITFINYVTKAMNTIAQFVAVLSGKSSWIKATEVQGDYADSLNGTASAAKKAMGALASFDSLEVLNKKESSGGGGNAGGGFEEVPIDPEIGNAAKNLTEWLSKLKAAAEPAIEAFQKLWNEGLSKLKDFSYGTLIDFYNNFLVPVGKWVLGEGLPRFFNITNDMLNEIDWDRLKRSLAGLYDSISVLTVFVFDSLLDFYEYFLKPLSVWFFSDALPQLVDILKEFIDEVNWDTLNTSLENFWDAVGPYAEQFGQGLIDFFKDLKDIGVDFLNSIAPILDSITEALNEGDPENARSWGYALGELAVSVVALKAAFVGYEIISKGWEVIKSILGYLAGAYAGLTLGATGINGICTALVNFSNSVNPAMWPAIWDSLKVQFPGFGNWVDDIDDWLNKNIGEPVANFFRGFLNWDWSLSEDGFLANALECFRKVGSAVENQDWGEVGANIIEGILNGIGGVIGLVTEPVADFFEGLWDAICDVFGIHSPAKEMEPLGMNIFLGIIEGFTGTFSEFTTAITEWWNTYVMPWFSAEKWNTLGQGILDGISTKWIEFCDWWNQSALGVWWEESVAPWFSAEKWIELAQGIVEGVSTKWDELVEWWDTNIVTWWEEYVAPWFTVEQWQKLGDNMKKGIYNGFCGIVSKVVDVMNGIISACENMINFIIDKVNELLNGANLLAQKAHIDINFGQLSPIKFDRVEMPKIPALANGAVLRGGNPMLAILNDQPAGQTNIEAPAALIKQMTREGIAESGLLRTASGSGEVQLIMEGQVVGKILLPHLLNEWNRAGYNISVLE